MTSPQRSSSPFDAVGDAHGEMAQRLKAFDWSATPLGRIETWPHSLVIAVSICLNSRFPMFVWWGPQHINIYNDGYIPMLGARHPAAFGRPAREAWNDIWADVGPQADLVMNHGQATWNERVHLRMERYGFPEDTWFTWSYSPIRDETGRVLGLYCAVTEDTARVRAEQERDRLAAQQQRSQARDRFLLSIDDAIRRLSEPDEIVLAVATLLGRYLDVDRCAYAHVEADEDTMNLIGNYCRTPEVRSIVGRLKFSDFGAEVLRLMHENRPYVVRDVDTHQPPIEDPASYRMTQIQAVICVPLHKSGRFVAAMAVHSAAPRDWTASEVELLEIVAGRCWESLERARVAQSLKDSEKRLRALVNATSDVVYRMNPDWSAIRQLHGRDFIEDTAIETGQWMERYIPQQDRASLSEAIDRAIRDKAVFELEHRVHRVDGSVGWVYSRAVPIFDDAGRITEWFGAAIDVTARREAEETLKHSEAALKEADRRKDEFLATLAHELRNPLAPISYSLQAIRMNGGAGASQAALDVIDRQVRQLVRLVDDLLDVSRISRGKADLRKAPVQLSTVLRHAVETVQPMLEQRGHSLRVDVPDAIELSADAARLSQVFANILNNAAKYTEPHGKIELAARRVPAGVIVSVRDNGIGIPRAQLDRVFDMFSQVDGSLERTQGGLGIGLTIAQRFVEMHGGSIRVHSDGPGKGSTFEVLLPVSGPVDASQDAGSLSPQDAAADSLRVMVVDDNQDVAESMGAMLRLLGHQTFVACDGSAALKAVESFAPDVALLDIGMPGMNGYEVCRRIKEARGSRTVVVAQTGWTEQQHGTRSSDAGFDHHLVKPVDIDALSRLLASIARDRQPS